MHIEKKNETFSFFFHLERNFKLAKLQAKNSVFIPKNMFD